MATWEEYRAADIRLRPWLHMQGPKQRHYRIRCAVMVDGKRCRNMAHAAAICNCHPSSITRVLNIPGGGYVKGHRVRFADPADEPSVCPCCGQTVDQEVA